MMDQLIFDPLFDQTVLFGAVIVALLLTGFAIWRGLRGWAWRALAALVIITALLNPSLRVEDRAPLPDIAVVFVDRSSSQTVSTRVSQTNTALDTLVQRLEDQGIDDIQIIEVPDGAEDSGTQLTSALAKALEDLPRDRVSGIFVLTDGQVHDVGAAPSTLPAPLHVLVTGEPDDWDKRLVVTNAPAFGILGETLEMTLRVEAQGAAPEGQSFDLNLSIDGGEAQNFQLPPNEDVTLEFQLPHGGRNVLHLSTPMGEGELTDRNNAAVLSVTGVRDRLRVLLVSGEPHAGERTWRNLLKSDSAVDLVHFTILRPFGKSDNVPLEELALIAFPIQELFVEKIAEFDLIIFDRYKRRGILPPAYFENIARYVERGGAVLMAAGPDFAGVDSLYRSPLSEILPAIPTARVIEEAFLPQLSDDGLKHPITRGLTATPDDPDWGRWLRQIDVTPVGGHTLMTGIDDAPLLIVDRVGEGRVALLASDHAWLWDRGYEGGGPQAELLRRLAHWMMKEPDLEEETLFAENTEQGVRILRRTMSDGEMGSVTITLPDGTTAELPMQQDQAGEFTAILETDQLGLFRFSNAGLDGVIARGPAAPREFIDTIATADILAPLAATTTGGGFALSDGLPRLRNVREGRQASGRNWMGMTPRGASAVTDVRISSFLPTWAYLLLAAGLMLLAWVREGR